MFGSWKKAKPHTRDERNPNYAQVFYHLLETHARGTNLSRDEYETQFRSKLEDKYAKYKAENIAPPLSGEMIIDSFILWIQSILGEHHEEEKSNPKEAYYFGYGVGLIDIGEVVFALAPGLSEHGLPEVEKTAKYAIVRLKDVVSGAEFGLADIIKLSLSSQPFSFGVYSACSDFLKELDRK